LVRWNSLRHLLEGPAVSGKLQADTSSVG